MYRRPGESPGREIRSWRRQKTPESKETGPLWPCFSCQLSWAAGSEPHDFAVIFARRDLAHLFGIDILDQFMKPKP